MENKMGAFTLIHKNLFMGWINCTKCNKDFEVNIRSSENLIYNNDNTVVGIRCPTCKSEGRIDEKCNNNSN
jgi:DNA-directed RNA polymerase subunit RPC12/RpoP